MKRLLFLFTMLLIATAAHAQSYLSVSDCTAAPPPGTRTAICYDASTGWKHNAGGAWVLDATGGGGGTTAGFNNFPTVTASGGNATATLLTQCTSAGCTDFNTLINASNAGTLTVTTPTAAALSGGQYLWTVVKDTGTAPSSIIHVLPGGATYSLDFGNLGNSATTGAACPAPPATGKSLFWWYYNMNASTLTLLGCTATPGASALAVAFGGTGGTTASKTTANNIGAAELGANSSITSMTGLTTALTAPQGGSGVISPTAHSLLVGEGASAFGQLVLTNDQILIGSTGADPSKFTLVDCHADAQHAYQYNTTTHAFTCAAITATAAAAGSTGNLQYNNAGALAGLSGTGLVKENGASAPTIAVSATDYAPATTGTSILKASAGGFANAVAGTDYAAAPTGTANTPLFNNGSNGFTNGTRSGNTTSVATTSGALTAGDYAGFDASGNVIDNGAGVSTPPASTTGAIQYNNSGVFGGAVISGLVKGNGVSAPSAATAGTDYAPITSGSAILRGNGAGGFSNTTAGTDYAAATPLNNNVLLGNSAGGFGNLAGNTLSAHNFSNSISAAGVLSGAQPASTDLSDIPFPKSSGGTATTYGANGTFIQKTNAVAGTTTNKLFTLDSSGNAINTPAASTTKVYGICDSGCGSGGTGTFLTGPADHSCVFDNGVTRGDYVGISTSVAGDCTDEGTSTQPIAGTQNIGYVDQATTGGAGTYTIFFYGPDFPGTASTGINVPAQAGNPAYFAGTTAVVSGEPKVVLLTTSGTDIVKTALTSTCPAAGPCTVILAPGVTDTASNITIGLASWDQTVIIDGGTINCTSTTGTGTACIGIRDTGRLVCTQHSNGTGGKNIQASSTSQYDAIVANNLYAGAGNNTHFDMEDCAVSGNNSATLNNAVLEIAGVAGLGYVENAIIGPGPAAADDVLLTGTGAANDNGILITGLWAAEGNTTAANALHFSSVAGNSGTVVGAACVGCWLVDMTGSGSYLKLDNNSTGTNYPTGIAMISTYYEIPTGYSGDIISLGSGFDLSLIAQSIYHSGAPTSTYGVHILSSANLDQFHIDGRIQGSVATNTLKNENTGYNNAIAGGFNYTYTALTNSTAPVYDSPLYADSWGPMAYHLPNASCTAASTPAACCTGNGTGTCTALPVCNGTGTSTRRAGTFTCVADATACTAGTTYAGGGSTLCEVQCNQSGALWKETGKLCF